MARSPPTWKTDAGLAQMLSNIVDLAVCGRASIGTDEEREFRRWRLKIKISRSAADESRLTALFDNRAPHRVDGGQRIQGRSDLG
jgi:hypothetical protein